VNVFSQLSKLWSNSVCIRLSPRVKLHAPTSPIPRPGWLLAPTISISNADYTVVLPSATTYNPVVSRIEFTYTGRLRVSTSSSSGFVDSYNVTNSWATDGVINGAESENYQIRATAVGTPSGTHNTPNADLSSSAPWLRLGTTKLFETAHPAGAPGSSSLALFIEIRNAITGVVIDSATITLGSVLT
jgi:hypothetical protein